MGLFDSWKWNRSAAAASARLLLPRVSSQKRVMNKIWVLRAETVSLMTVPVSHRHRLFVAGNAFSVMGEWQQSITGSWVKSEKCVPIWNANGPPDRTAKGSCNSIMQNSRNLIFEVVTHTGRHGAAGETKNAQFHRNSIAFRPDRWLPDGQRCQICGIGLFSGQNRMDGSKNSAGLKNGASP